MWSAFGSANFDNRSLELNDEMNVAARDRDLASQFTQQFHRDLEHSQRLELWAWRGRPRPDKVREQFWRFFSEIF